MIELGTPAEVAKVLHTSEAALAQMRYRGDGPIFVRAGRRRVLYRWADVEAWIKSSRRTRTDEAALRGEHLIDGRAIEGRSDFAPGRPGRRSRDECDQFPRSDPGLVSKSAVYPYLAIERI